MAENENDQDREDLSDEPSQYRLEEFRKQGRVAQSRELNGMLALLAAGVAAYTISSGAGASMIEFMREAFRTDVISKADLAQGSLLETTLMKALKLIGWAALPVGLASLVVGVVASFAQIGSVFSSEPITPDLKRVNPIQGFMRFFTLKFLLDSLRLTAKIAVAAMVAYMLVKATVFDSPRYILQDPMSLFEGFSDSGRTVFLSLFGVFLVFSGLDYWLQRWEFMKQARLTKQEAKQESKEHDGDPLLKARVRAIQRDTARKRMMDAVKTADVIVTNPTHIAIAIKYDRENMDAPKVIAKGADFLAQKIKMLAADAGVPLVENVPLARTLYKSVKVGQVVPRALYQAVAEVLAYVYRLRAKKG